LITFAVAAVTTALHLAVATAPAASAAPTPSRSSAASASRSAPARPPRAPSRAPARAPLEEPAPQPVPDEPRDPVDLSEFPPEQRERYLLAREKCARCHGFARAVGSRLSVGNWKRHLKKMAVRPNTAISDEQAQAILEFLKLYASSQK
jgi:hypothetical protein